MLIELSIIPLNRDTHTSDEIAKALRIIDDSGLPYQLMPSGTCIEGDWNEVMPIIEQCHIEVRKNSPHVITLIKIEDDEGAKNKLKENIQSVQEKGGRTFEKKLVVNESF